jgi:hypothetical protein
MAVSDKIHEKARLMRVATSLGLCDSNLNPECAEPETIYSANSKTEIMTKPLGRDGLRCLYVLRATNTLSL